MVRGNSLRHDRVRSDEDVIADDDVSQDLGARADHHPVADSGVPFGSGWQLLLRSRHEQKEGGGGHASFAGEGM